MKKIIFLCFCSLSISSLFAQWTTSGNNIYNSNSGNVGIGTTSPSTLWSKVLQVYDNNNAALSVRTSVADWQLVTDASGGLHFRDITGGGNAGRLFIGSNGYVGIGTTSPVTKFHLYQGTFFIDNASTNQIALQNAGSYYGSIFTPEAGKWSLGYGANKETIGQGVLTWTDAGNVGIGTTNTQGYKLAVNGNAIFTKAVVKAYANWPDYVFHNSYELRPLAQLEQFILLNKHLPEVPSAKEVEKNGLDLGDNQALLLKKIEELTLYILELNKKLESQQTEINDLKKSSKSSK